MENEATDGFAPSVFDVFPGAVRAVSYKFPRASGEGRRRETAGLDSRPVPDASCSHRGKPQTQRTEDWCSQKGTL